MPWHEGNVSRWQREKTIASKLLDAFESGIDEEGRACFTGIFHVYSQHGHLYEAVRLRFVYPPTFPHVGSRPQFTWRATGDAGKNAAIAISNQTGDYAYSCLENQVLTSQSRTRCMICSLSSTPISSNSAFFSAVW